MDNTDGELIAARQLLTGTGSAPTLAILGTACGRRLRAAAEALEQDPHQLVFQLGTAIIERLNEALGEQRQAREKLRLLWQRMHPGSVLLPEWFHPEIQEQYWRLWARKFSRREKHWLDRALTLFSRRQRRRTGEALRAREMDDALAPFLEVILGKVRARDADERWFGALTDGAARWFRWRRNTDPDSAAAAARRRRQEVRRRNAMRLVADMLLGRIFAAYDVASSQDLCYFVSGLLRACEATVPVLPPEEH